MPSYFNYILEASAEEDNEEIDSINEMDVILGDFDSYVQEGVGIAVLAGIGIAAALGGLIALIIKLFSNKSGNSVGQETKKAMSILDKAKKAGIKNVVLSECPTDKYFKALEVALEIADITCDGLDGLLYFLGNPSDELPESIRNMDEKNENSVQSHLGISYDNYEKNHDQLLENSVKHNANTDIDDIESILKTVRAKGAEFMQRAKRLHDIQDKYKKLGASNPESYRGYDDFFIDRINNYHTMMTTLGKSQSETVTIIEKDILKAMKANSTDSDENVPEAFIKAVNNKNIRSIRIMMKNSLLVDLTYKEFDAMDKMASSIPGLYDKHDGKELIEDKSKWDEHYVSRLMTQVISNFSHERVDHLKDVVRYLRT